MNLIGGFQNTNKTNGEDFALTPYISLIYNNGITKVFGLGFTWGYYSIFIASAFNKPKGYPNFKNYK